MLCNTILTKKDETKPSSKKSTKPTKSLETNPNVNNTIATEAEEVDLEDLDEQTLVDLDEDSTSEMLWVICLVDDLDEVEDLASAKEKISSKPSQSHLKKHTWE